MDITKHGNEVESRRPLKPYGHQLFSKPIVVNRKPCPPADPCTPPASLTNTDNQACYDTPDVEPHTENSFTQTSKTILQLAKEEKEKESRSLSPDSLSGSPGSKREVSRVTSLPIQAEVQEPGESFIELCKKTCTADIKAGNSDSEYTEYGIDKTQLPQYFDCSNYTPDGSIADEDPDVNLYSQSSKSAAAVATGGGAADADSEYRGAPYGSDDSNQMPCTQFILRESVTPPDIPSKDPWRDHTITCSPLVDNFLRQKAKKHSSNTVPVAVAMAAATGPTAPHHRPVFKYQMLKSQSFVEPSRMTVGNASGYMAPMPFGDVAYDPPPSPQDKSSPHGYPMSNAQYKSYFDASNSMGANASLSIPPLTQQIISDPQNLLNNRARGTTRSLTPKRCNTFMLPTVASEQKSCMDEVRRINRLLSPTVRGRSLSPTNRVEPMRAVLVDQAGKVPYIDTSLLGADSAEPFEAAPLNRRMYKERARAVPSGQIKIGPVQPKIAFDDNLMKIDEMSIRQSLENLSVDRSSSVSSFDNAIATVLNRVRHDDWNMALKGLAEITDMCRTMDADTVMPHMTVINQRLLELMRSPRSHVCRTACQAAGHLFESMKDTRKPEFEDIVNTLLYKTADANKFIRQDANLALDCMVTHIPSFHSIKALCAKGPIHKNPLVRCATIRLIICAVVIAGPQVILNPANSDYTRKRIILLMAKFINDKNFDTRKYAERLYKVLSREKYFDLCLKKYLEKEELEIMKRSLKGLINGKK